MTMLTSALVALSLTQAPAPLDAATFKERLQVLTDGKKHYIAFDAKQPTATDALFTSNDGKTFTRVPAFSASSDSDQSWSVSYWDPRVRTPETGPGEVRMSDAGKNYSVTCAKKTTALTVLSLADSKALLEGATFMPPSWTRLPERLFRDDMGTYYLVDRFRSQDASDRRDFRVFAGPKGAMKLLALKDLVDDSQGMIFATKNGHLRLVTGTDGKFDPRWVVGTKSTKLIEIDLDRFDTGRLIYLDLGPYSGQRLGTPCDDFM